MARSLLTAFVLISLSATASAQTVAVVNGQEIDAAEVRQFMQEAFGKRPISDEALPAVQARALEQVIDRRLVLAWLEREQQGVSAKEVDAVVEQFKKHLELQKLPPLEEFLKKDGLTPESLRRKINWQMSWKRHRARAITDEVLKQHFEAARRQYDGSQVRVGHLLLKSEEGATAEAVRALVDRAAQLRQQIAAGAITFERAVEQHSEGSKRDGGDLGFIRRHGSMPEPFSAAAFALEPGQVSPPVHTPFGIHLIRCREIKPGNKTLEDKAVRAAVELAAAQQLFENLAARQRRAAEIRYTGAMPHYKPGTRELAE